MSTQVNGLLGLFASQSDAIFRGTAQTAGHMAQLLAIIEIIWFVWQTMINKRSVEELLSSFAQKIIGLALMLSLIYWIGNTGGSYVVTMILKDFGGAGQSVGAMAGGARLTSPDDFISYGFSTALGLMAKAVGPLAAIAYALGGLRVFSGAISIGCNLVAGTGSCGPSMAAANAEAAALNGINMATFALFGVIVTTGLACLGVLIGFVRLAIKLLMVTVETYLVLAAATILLGFSTSRWTKGIAQPFQRYVLQLAFRTFAIYLVAGIATAVVGSLDLTISFNLDVAKMLVTPVQQILTIFLAAAMINALLAAPERIAEALMGNLYDGGAITGAGTSLGAFAGGAVMQGARHYAAAADAAQSDGHNARTQHGRHPGAGEPGGRSPAPSPSAATKELNSPPGTTGGSGLASRTNGSSTTQGTPPPPQASGFNRLSGTPGESIMRSASNAASFLAQATDDSQSAVPRIPDSSGASGNGQSGTPGERILASAKSLASSIEREFDDSSGAQTPVQAILAQSNRGPEPSMPPSSENA